MEIIQRPLINFNRKQKIILKNPQKVKIEIINKNLSLLSSHKIYFHFCHYFSLETICDGDMFALSLGLRFLRHA